LAVPLDLSAKGELDATLGKGVADVAGVGHRSCEAVELRYDEGVALTHRGQGLIQAGPFPVGAGEAMIEVDPLLGDAELAEPFALGGEVLLVGAAAA
jgi:hypothetical protein